MSYEVRNLYDPSASISGYVINDVGQIYPGDSTKQERTSDYIPMANGQTLYATVYVTIDAKDGYPWVGYAFYGSDKSAIKNSRSSLHKLKLRNGKHVFTDTITCNYDDAAYMRYSTRTYGNARVMISTAPAAWAPAEGEELAGGGAQMSANLWDASTTGGRKPDADGVYLVGKTSGGLLSNIAGMSALAENQTIHMGASLRGADKGTLKPYVAYIDAAGNWNYVGFPHWTPTGSWQRFEGSCVVPSGMTIVRFGFNEGITTGDIEVTNPVFSYGSAVTLASSAHTPYATQDHVSTVYATKAALKVTSDAVTAEVEERGKLAGKVGTLESTSSTHTSKLEQLATSIKSLVKGESTYTDPDGKSATSGIYSLVTQTRDSVTALFGSYTKTADLASTQAVRDAKKAGTDAASAASAAQSTADTAKSTADSLATMIREDATGITVGKSADGQTYSTGRTHMDEDSFDVLDKAGNVLSSFGKSIIELGKNSQDAVISMLAGLVKIKAIGISDGAWCEISTDEFVSTNGYRASRIAAGYKDETGFIPQGVAEVTVEGGEDDGGVLMYAGAHGSEGNSFAMSPAAYTLNHPEYMLSALLGSGGGGSGVTMASDLDTCGPGVFSYNASTANRPTDQGVCLSFVAGSGNWLFEFALPTRGDPHWRRNISGGGWTSWWTITSQENISGVADVAWTDLWKDTSGHYVQWACRNNVVYVKWKIPQATTAQWKAGILPAGYRPSEGTVTVAAWTEGDRMATGWVDIWGDVFFAVNSAQTDGTNQGSLSYPIF